MKFLSVVRLLPVLSVGALFALSSSSYADHDGHDGHGHGDLHGWHGDSHGDWHGHYGGYYHGGYGYGYHGWGWGRPYFWGPSFGVTVYDGGPYYDYYDGPAVYRGVPRYGYSGNLVVDVQHALKRRGYYTGPLDGQPGPGTRAAIRAFQIDRHLPVSGRIDGNVVRSLGLD